MAGQTTNYLFDYPTSTDYVKDGATAIQTLATDVDTTLFTALGGAYPGLRLVKKQVIGSGVSSISVTNAFSATYENYKILITGGVGSTTGDFTWILTGITSGYYNNLINQTWGSGPVSGVGQANVSNGLWIGGYATNAMYAEMDIQSPFLTKIKTIQARNFGLAAGTSVGVSSCFINNTTSATGITFSTAGGSTVTGGTIYVYGYGAS